MGGDGWVGTEMVVFVGVEQGIILAIVLSLVDHTRRGYRPKNVVLVPSETGVLRARPVATHAQAAPGLLIYRFTHSMYYANSEQLSEEITGLVNSADPALRWFCIDASAVDDLTKLSMSSRVEEIFTSGAGAAQELTGDVEEEGNVPKEVRERPKGRRRSVRPARTEAEIAQIRAERAAKRELTGASPHQDGRG